MKENKTIKTISIAIISIMIIAMIILIIYMIFIKNNNRNEGTICNNESNEVGLKNRKDIIWQVIEPFTVALDNDGSVYLNFSQVGNYFDGINGQYIHHTPSDLNNLRNTYKAYSLNGNLNGTSVDFYDGVDDNLFNSIKLDVNNIIKLDIYGNSPIIVMKDIDNKISVYRYETLSLEKFENSYIDYVWSLDEGESLLYLIKNDGSLVKVR